VLSRGLIAQQGTAARGGRPLSLTDDGRRLVAEVAPLFVAREARMTSTLTDAERTVFDQLLLKMTLRDDGWPAEPA
jgi:DNA-binding MarR family transcriptional regulator